MQGCRLTWHTRASRPVLPDLFHLGPITVYTYGVLLAAAYLLGLKLAMTRARARGLDATRMLDLGIYIIISALVGAKLLLLIVDFDQFRSDPAELLSLARSGGVFYGGLILAVVGGVLVHAAAPAAALADVRRVRARHRPRSRRRPPRVSRRGLLLRPADERAVGRDVHQPARPRPTWGRRSTCRSIPRSCTRARPRR